MKRAWLVVALAAVAALCVDVTPASAAPTIHPQVTAGYEYTCALTSGGGAKCWGRNITGQLGNGTLTESWIPRNVSDLSGATQITAGHGHTCALIGGGTVKCWGGNRYGQLGYTSSEDCGELGVSFLCTTIPTLVPSLSGATQVAAGDFHTCALVTDGEVKCWGRNWAGQLGNGTTTDSATPVSVAGLTGATRIAAGASHTCALVSGAVKCWGYGGEGQLGNGTSTNSSTPVDVTGLSDATRIAAGAYHTCALVSDGAAMCWGQNIWGELGNGTRQDSGTPVSVRKLTDATRIAGGDYHTCALISDGTVACWGLNNRGQLGNDVRSVSSTPMVVPGLSGAARIATGGYHSCALGSDGTVTCWGGNSYGQLGNATEKDSSSPVPVRSGATSLSIVAPSLVVASTEAKISGVLSAPSVPACRNAHAVYLKKDRVIVASMLTSSTGAYAFTTRITGRTVVQVIFKDTVSCLASASPKRLIKVTTPIPGGRYAIGDPVMLGAKDELQHRGFVVNAVTSRQFHDAVRIVKRKAAEGSLRRRVVIHLGTDGTPIQPSDCDAIAKAASALRHVYLVTVTGPTGDPAVRKAQNTRLRVCASRHANTSVIDWYGYSRGHARWFSSDGMHLTATGQRAYAAFLDTRTS